MSGSSPKKPVWLSNRTWPPLSSVVNMSATGTVGRQSGTRIGSGVVCTSDGLIVANDHVVTRWTARSLPGRASRSQQLLGGLPQLHARHHLVAGPGIRPTRTSV